MWARKLAPWAETVCSSEDTKEAAKALVAVDGLVSFGMAKNGGYTKCRTMRIGKEKSNVLADTEE